MANEDYVRLTNEVKGQTGLLWNEESFPGNEIDVFVEVKVHGSAQGADGMAVWLTEEPVRATGPFLGGPNKFRGVAIILDSFDNDSKGNNPRIGILSNDGTKFVDKELDGSNLDVGGCMYGFRNLDKGVMLHIKYNHGTLDVSMGNKDLDLAQFHSCASKIPVHLPLRVHLSITAETGGLTDNHDVLSVAAFTDIREHANDATGATKDATDDSAEKQKNDSASPSLSSEEKKKDHDDLEEPSDEDLEKGLPEHATHAPLAFHFSSVFKDLADIGSPSHPDHVAFKEDLQLMKIDGLKTDQDRFGFLLDGVFAMEEHTDLMIRAFEQILQLIDNERFRVQSTHHQFAEAFNQLYENVASKKEVEDALHTLAGKRSLLKASRRIHKLVDSALDSVEGVDSPVGRLGAIARDMDPASSELYRRHTRNRDSLIRTQESLEVMRESARSSGGWSFIDWIMLAEILLFALFAASQVLRKKEKMGIL